MPNVITADDVRDLPAGAPLVVPPGTVITPWAREICATRGVAIVSGAAPPPPRTVAVGADHGGFPLKEALKGVLARLGHRVIDMGTFSKEAVDYPDFAVRVARAVAAGEAQLGIVVDGAGLGSAMAANKVPGIRAAPCVDARAAKSAREHNDANVMTLGAGWMDEARLPETVSAFLTAVCTEDRHRRRVQKISAIEEGYRK